MWHRVVWYIDITFSEEYAFSTVEFRYFILEGAAIFQWVLVRNTPKDNMFESKAIFICDCNFIFQWCLNILSRLLVIKTAGFDR
jgi:hypothetical protein